LSSRQGEVSTAVKQSDEVPVRTIAVFTGVVSDIRLDASLASENFTAISAEDAAGRTIYHLPRILQVIEQNGVVHSSGDLAVFSEALERSSQFQVAAYPVQEYGAESAKNGKEPHYRTKTKRSAWWIVPLLMLVAIVAFYIIRSVVRPTMSTPDTTASIVARPNPMSQVVIELPSEQQLFISGLQYKTRSELDRALSHGEGRRFLPSNEHVLVFDSVTFAKGVYGYFKVPDATGGPSVWRKGKLLQTFAPNDTIHIVTFLDPLPGG